MKVQDVMTRNVAVCSPDDGLNRAAQLMWEGDCGCVPVVDGDGAVRGIITDRDICMAGYTTGLPLHEIRVQSAMSKHIVAASPDDDVETAQALMQKNKVRRLPVTDGDRLVGILSLSDLLRAPAQPRKAAGMRTDGIVQTLATITTPGGQSPSQPDGDGRKQPSLRPSP